MITMTNVLKRGRTTWDRALLPEDEYYERARVLREVIDAAGLDALVSLGHATRPGAFTYLSGFVPALGWMGTVLTREQGPVLVSGGGSRELPFLRSQTWIEDLRTSRSLFTGPAEVVGATVSELVSDGARIGLVGAHDALNPVTRAELYEILSPYEVVDADQLLETVRAAKRPRELVALRRSLAIAREAVAAAVARYDGGAPAAEATLAAEHIGRMRGCRDVRVLGDLGDGELSPVERLSDRRGSRFAVYCAVEHRGYWGQACASSGESPAAVAAVEAMVAAAAVGVEVGELARAALAALPSGAQDVALSYGLGGGIGLDPSERPEVSLTATDVIAAGTVLALQTMTPEPGGLGCADATILVAPEGVTRL
jgi:Xaa-Pro aminopeptidase